jgi:hypothetical protein
LLNPAIPALITNPPNSILRRVSARRFLSFSIAEEKNIDLTVDLNHTISERHQGKIKSDELHYLHEDNKIRQQMREDLIRNDVGVVLNHLSTHHSVFTRRDVEKLLFKSFKDTQNPNEYLTFVEQVLGNNDVIHLGTNDKNKECYTTRHQYIQEARLRSDIEKMMRRSNHVFTNLLLTIML